LLDLLLVAPKPVERLTPTLLSSYWNWDQWKGGDMKITVQAPAVPSAEMSKGA
jgi:hypothetical protein